MCRRFRTAVDLEQQEQRVAAVCSRQFMLHSIRLDLEHEGIELNGWLALPDYHRSQTSGQYFYVNNRPVKDRVLSHAIRQAYQNFIPEGRVPAYVLYLTMDPRQVDVNVHPTKHEVRFHNVRLIHDLLVQAVVQGLSEGSSLLDHGFLEDNKTTTAREVSSNHRQANYKTSSTSDQYQAYGALLSSVAEPNQKHLVNEDNQGWIFLTKINESVLLEYEQSLYLLSMNILLSITDYI